MFSRLYKNYFIYTFLKSFYIYFCMYLWRIQSVKANYPFFAVQVVPLIIQIILFLNLVFDLRIHPDSKLLHYLFICTVNRYCTILLHIILRLALFDTSAPPVSATNCRLHSPCIHQHTPPYLYSIACVVLFL